MQLLEGTDVTPQERDSGRSPARFREWRRQGDVGHRASKMSPGGLFSCLGIYYRSNGRGRGEKESWKRSGGDGDWFSTETASLCSQLTLFSVVAAPSLQTGKRVFRTEQSKSGFLHKSEQTEDDGSLENLGYLCQQ